jgi:ADP-ribose pyrophosphatase
MHGREEESRQRSRLDAGGGNGGKRDSDSDRPPRMIVRTLLRRGPKFDIEIVSTTGRDGKLLEREVVRHPGAVVIVPVLDSGGVHGPEVVLIQNFRLSLERRLLELPAGTRVPGEDPLVCAARELEEETGYQAKTLQHIARWHTGPGMTDEVMECVVATGLSFAGQHLENDEDIRVETMPAREAMQRIWTGEITDAKTIIALHWALKVGAINA